MLIVTIAPTAHVSIFRSTPTIRQCGGLPISSYFWKEPRDSFTPALCLRSASMSCEDRTRCNECCKRSFSSSASSVSCFDSDGSRIASSTPQPSQRTPSSSVAAVKSRRQSSSVE